MHGRMDEWTSWMDEAGIEKNKGNSIKGGKPCENERRAKPTQRPNAPSKPQLPTQGATFVNCSCYYCCFLYCSSYLTSETTMPQNSSDGALIIGIVLATILTSFVPSAEYGAEIIRAIHSLLERMYVLGVLAYLSVLFYNDHSQASRIRGIGQKAQQDDVRVADDGSYVVVSPPESLGGEEDNEEDDGDIVNLTGTFKLAKNVDFDKFLEAQGVGWALRSAANKARPVHTITHRGRTLRIQITGIITGDTTYKIGGPPVTSQIRDRVFSDTVQYLDSKDGIRVHKQCVSGGDGKILVTRQLSTCGSELTMRSKCVFEDGRESVEAVQTFERVS